MYNLPKRKPQRLKDYDYSQNGCYFVTICTYRKQNLFEMSNAENDPCVVPQNQTSVGNDLCVVPSNQTSVGNDLRVVPPKFQANKIIEKWLAETENKFNVKIEYYIIMPNHIHFILSITDNQIQTERHTGRSLQEMVQWFKTMTTNEYIQCVKNGTLQPFNKKIWQKSYYEHIIRNETDHIQTAEYILNNPLKRELEKNNNNL